MPWGLAAAASIVGIGFGFAWSSATEAEHERGTELELTRAELQGTQGALNSLRVSAEEEEARARLAELASQIGAFCEYDVRVKVKF